MDMDSYEETRLSRDDSWAKYLKEGTTCSLLFYSGKVSLCIYYCGVPNRSKITAAAGANTTAFYICAAPAERQCNHSTVSISALTCEVTMCTFPLQRHVFWVLGFRFRLGFRGLNPKPFGLCPASWGLYLNASMLICHILRLLQPSCCREHRAEFNMWQVSEEGSACKSQLSQQSRMLDISICCLFCLFHLAVLCDSLSCGAYGTFCYGLS